MSLFRKKNIEEKHCSCASCNSGIKKAEPESAKGDAAAKILGGGCAKCNQLEANTAEALRQLGLSEEIDHVREYSAIAAYGVMTTPALVFRGKVLCYGKVLKTDEIAALIQKEI